MILFIVYLALGYWATGKTIYANKTVIYSGTSFMCKKMGLGVVLGWILIPIALIKILIGK